MIRRSFLKLMGVSCAPIPGLPLGAEEQVYVAMTYLGLDVTERLPVEFRWNSEMRITLAKGHDFRTDGSAVYLDPQATEPFREKSFGVLQIRPTDTLNVTWIFRRAPDSKG